MTELVVLPPLKAQLGQQGGYVLTKKYMEGVAEFAKTWPGPVTSLVEITQTPSTDMDHAEFALDHPDTPLEKRPDTQVALADRLKNAALVVTFLAPSEEPLVALCRKIGVPLVFWAEYSPQTEVQILKAGTTNPLRRWRGQSWLKGATNMRRQMVAQSAGLQCSGRPVYDAYADLSPNPMVFWDNRVRSAEIIADADLAERAAILRAGAPLRLAFGGRLIEMKGIQYLPEFAQKLRQMGIPFQLDVYGTGPREAYLRHQISARGLSDQVALKGALDFRTEWLPTLRAKVDLFICPHPQGDPSSTYPETMSCGLPTLGFDNEAFASIAEASDSGWTVPIGDTTALARQVATLHQDRDQMIAHARRARDFAQDHSFEETMQRRVSHFLAASQSGLPRPDPLPT
jgi:colanic acid/amylovoran biosynthesis glycosyltransferase